MLFIARFSTYIGGMTGLLIAVELNISKSGVDLVSSETFETVSSDKAASIKLYLLEKWDGKEYQKHYFCCC